MEVFVRLEYKKNIAEITFGTPKSNALPSHILENLSEKILEAGANSEVRVVLLKSQGERAFCAGASFDELLEIQDLETSKHFFGGFAKVLNAMRTCGKIVVVRVQGKVTGGGVGIVCAADYCFATESAALALTELNLGIGPFVIGPFVERKIGKSQFIAMALDTEFRSAEWAMKNHIYHRLFSTITDMDVALENFVQNLSERSIEALSLIKKISWEQTEQLQNLMPERIVMSASLVLKDEAKIEIQKAKQRLGKSKK